VRGSEHGMRTADVGNALLAQAAKTVPGFQHSAVSSVDDANHACPSATVADTLSLPS
jgi:hypothetical protein